MAHKYPSFQEALRRRNSDISIDSDGPTKGRGFRADSTAIYRAGGSHGPLKQLPIPDLRFESAFVASISPYILRKDAQAAGASQGAPSSLVPGQQTQLDLLNDPVSVQWGSVAFVLLKDQLVLPLLNGVVWTMASIMLIQGWKKISR